MPFVTAPPPDFEPLQLTLPHVAEPGFSVWSRQVGLRGHVRVQLGADGVRVEAAADLAIETEPPDVHDDERMYHSLVEDERFDPEADDDPPSVGFELVTAPGAGPRFRNYSGRVPVARSWSLLPRVRVRGRRNAHDPFASAVALVRGMTHPSVQLQDQSVALTHAAMQHAAEHAVALCGREDRHVSLRFHPADRFGVYCELVRANHPYVRQLATSCPGALLWLSAVRPHAEGRELLSPSALVSDIIQGRKLDRALDDALAFWTEELEVLPLGALPHETVARACDLEVQGDPDALARQYRQFIRRAGTRVTPTDLLAGPPDPLIVQDIPVAPHHNALWYRLMAIAMDVTSDEPDVDRAFRRMLSARAVELEARARRASADLRELVEAMHLVCVRDRRFVPRGVALQPLVDEARVEIATARLARRAARGTALRDLILHGRPVQYASVHRKPPAPYERGGLSVRELTTPDDLADEGARMQHCLKSDMHPHDEPDHLRRRYYAIEAGGERLTAEVRRRRRGYYLAHLSGFENATASAAAREKVLRWLGRAHAATPPERAEELLLRELHFRHYREPGILTSILRPRRQFR